MKLGLPYTLPQMAAELPALDLFQGAREQAPLAYLAFDTRKISHGRETLFVALETDNRDGHDFIEDAMEKGVQNFLVSRHLEQQSINYVLVEDTLDALQLWARQHRQKFSYPVLGITGSNGKTTVKEWLASLLEVRFQIVKSPMSYNSQLGVPLSVLQMHPQADLAIIEAGISQVGEMERLQAIIQPDLGMLTHMGDAHADGFVSEQQKLDEKLRLFEEVDVLLTASHQWWVRERLQDSPISCKTVGKLATDQLQLLQAVDEGDGWRLRLTDHHQTYDWLLPLSGKAALENALLAILAAQHLGMAMKEIQERLLLLYPVEMRTEIITDNPEITLINDGYNADPDSIRNAFRMLANMPLHPRYRIVLSDVPHLGEKQRDIQRELLAEAESIAGRENVYTLGPVFGGIRAFQHYLHTQDLIDQFDYERFRNSTVLLKGARAFELERLVPLLNRTLNATYFKIRLDKLVANFRFLKARLPEHVKAMCMVKAASYGAGTWEIARELAAAGADYLAVAYASEGIALRQANVQLPIMVMNPDLSSIPALIEYEIEPEIFHFTLLDRYLRAARLAGLQEYRIHLKFDTGMGRLGFSEDELDELVEYLGSYPDLNVISVMTHLAAATQEAEDAFSHAQVQRFQRMYNRLADELGIFAFRHVLNTAGILRFPQYAFDMVRMGIGLYGVSPLIEGGPQELEEIGSLHTTISQIHRYPAGSSIGYGRAQYTRRESRIATIPIGYADGIPRSLGLGKLQALVGGVKVPGIGQVCMDMLMLDITDVPQAQEGDEVVIWGRQGGLQRSIREVAEQAGTIPYELLTHLSSRVRRIYVKEDGA